MKVISVIQAIMIEAFNGTGNYQAGETEKLIEPAEENRAKVIYGAALVEQTLGLAISVYFFRDHPNRTLSKQFGDYVLSASWCGFDAKRGLVEMIVSEIDFKDKAWRKKYADVLQAVIRYRNAFTHGTISTNGREVKLAWFSRTPQERILTDEWLSKVEKSLRDAHNLTQEILVYIGPKLPNRNVGDGSADH